MTRTITYDETKFVLVPKEPTEEMWDGLPRDIVMWMQMAGPHYGSKLYRHLRNVGEEIPAWLLEEIPDKDHTPPKGTIAVCIYKAICAAAPQHSAQETGMKHTECPFCGSLDTKIEDDEGFRIKYTQCMNCEATGPTIHKCGNPDEGEEVLDWDTRAAHPTDDAVRDAVLNDAINTKLPDRFNSFNTPNDEFGGDCSDAYWAGVSDVIESIAAIKSKPVSDLKAQDNECFHCGTDHGGLRCPELIATSTGGTKG